MLTLRLLPGQAYGVQPRAYKIKAEAGWLLLQGLHVLVDHAWCLAHQSPMLACNKPGL